MMPTEASDAVVAPFTIMNDDSVVIWLLLSNNRADGLVTCGGTNGISGIAGPRAAEPIAIIGGAPIQGEPDVEGINDPQALNQGVWNDGGISVPLALSQEEPTDVEADVPVAPNHGEPACDEEYCTRYGCVMKQPELFGFLAAFLAALTGAECQFYKNMAALDKLILVSSS